ncbi:MAG: chemotaxis protein CheX [Gammaproteobacteria bacterium]|nr:chemotaxis protein CheX [Gammaproteobacteria bacterium]MDH5651419.1 chemotaxis protein CheX [Gammaproteobacteria bacterium]
MDIMIINALLDSLMKVFNTMVGIKAVPGVPVAKDDEISRGEVTGMMLMENDKTHGSMAISFSKAAISRIAKNMLGDDLQDIDDTARDLTGEMTNMLVGGAKKILSEQGMDFNMSTPAVFYGKGHQIQHKFNGQTVILPFNTNSEEFYLEINFV